MAHLVTMFDTRDRTGTYEVHTNGVIKVGVFDSINNLVTLGDQTEDISMPLTHASRIVNGIHTYVLGVMRNIWNWDIPKLSSRGIKIEFEQKDGETELVTSVRHNGDWLKISEYEINLTDKMFTFKEAAPVTIPMSQYLYHDRLLTEWVDWANSPNEPFILK